MELHALWIFLALISCSIVISPSYAQIGAPLVVREGAALVVRCLLRVEQAPQWRVNGSNVGTDAERSEVLEAQRLVATLRVAHATVNQSGLYTCAPDAEGVLVHVMPRHADASVVESAAEPMEYEVGGEFKFECDIANPNNLPVKWSKNGVEVVAGSEKWPRVVTSGATLKSVGRTHEDDYGSWACSVGDAVKAWALRGKPVARMTSDTAVVEGQRLKVVCRVIGKPLPEISWTVGDKDSNTTAAEALGERGRLEANGTELILENAQRSDANEYHCRPLGGKAASTTVRVKDMYAAIWPFVGICAEVLVLCIVILVYEKRRSKPEMDDSDVDADQKKS